MSRQKQVHPGDLVHLMELGLAPTNPVAFDTETSGLWTDAGARVSTVSVGFIVEEDELSQWVEVLGGGDQHLWDTGIWTLRKETTAMARASTWTRGDWVQEHWVLSFAWPFDQGHVGTGKPEDRTAQILEHGKGGLLADLDWTPDKPKAEPNLGRIQWEQLVEWLQEQNSLTAHNAKFDVHIGRAGLRGEPKTGVDLLACIDWDTQVGADIWTMWRTADFGKTTTSLKPTAQWLWGVKEGDEKRVIAEYLRKHKLPPGRWDLVPWRVIARYADQDARLTVRLRKWQEVEQKRAYGASKVAGTPEYGWKAGGGKDQFERRMDTMRMLSRVERRGVPFDAEGAREAAKVLEGRIAEVEAVLSEALAGQVTLPVAKHYWFGQGDKLFGEKGQKEYVRGLGLQPYALTDSGGPVVDQATLSRMLRDGVPLTEEWMAYKKLTDAKSRWYDGWADRAGADGRLRPGFRQNGTASGRFSVENIQLQAIPADYKVRGILDGVPSPRDLIGAGIPAGFEMWEMDLAQAELRVAAKMAGCEKMLDLIAKGADLHGETATALFGSKPGDESWGQDRQVAKRSNFSLIFGVGWATFQETLWKEAGIAMPENEVRMLIANWNALYPEFKRAIKKHDDVVMRRFDNHGVGWIDIGSHVGLGERRWFTKWDVEYYDPARQRLNRGAHKAFNQRVQPSLAQYGIDLWLWIDQYLMDRFPGLEKTAGLVLMVHDSSVLLVPEGTGAEVTREIAAYGEELWERWFPGLPGGLDASSWKDHA